MAALTKEQISAAQDIKVERLDVPEWGGHVFVRSMTGVERDAYDQWMYDNRKEDGTANICGMRARAAGLTLCDESGKLLYEEGTVSELDSRSSAAIERVWDVTRKLNRLGGDQTEELVKNSESDQS